MRTDAATDFDTADEQPWASHAITHDTRSGGYIESIVAVFDDNSSLTFGNITTASIGNLPVDIGDRTTNKDALGRLDYAYETHNGVVPHSGPVPEVSRAMDWNTATGHMDHAVTAFRDGHVSPSTTTPPTATRTMP